MFKIFSGNWRGVQADQQRNADRLYMQVAFEFRRDLRHFKGATLSVLLCLALHANQQGESFPSYEQIQAETGYARDTVWRALEQLCGLEIDGQRVLLSYRLRDEQQHFMGSSHYILFPGPEQLAQFAGAPQVDPGGSSESHSPILPISENTDFRKSDLKDNQLFNEKKSMAQPQMPPEPQNPTLGADAPRAVAQSQTVDERIRAFPDDCCEAAGLLHELFGLKPPQKLPGERGDFGLWIKGLRSLNRLAADYGSPLEPALHLAWRQWNRAPFNLSHPAALLKTMTGALACAALTRGSAPPEACESPLAAALKTFVPRSRA